MLFKNVFAEMSLAIGFIVLPLGAFAGVSYLLRDTGGKTDKIVCSQFGCMVCGSTEFHVCGLSAKDCLDGRDYHCLLNATVRENNGKKLAELKCEEQ